MAFSFILAAALVAAVGRSHAAIIITAGPEPAHEEVQDMIRNSSARAWCRPGQIRQIITHSGCESQELDNMVCLGSCLSYSLPLTLPRNPGEESLNLCETCQTDKFVWVNVTLSCMKDDEPFEEVKQVQQIESCKCATCPGYKSSMKLSSPNDEEVVSDLINRALEPEDHPLAALDDAVDESSPGLKRDDPLSVLSLFPASNDVMVAPALNQDDLRRLRESSPNILRGYESNPHRLNLVELNEEFPLKYDSMKSLQYDNHNSDNADNDGQANGSKPKGLADIVKNLNKINYKSMSINEIRDELKKSQD